LSQPVSITSIRTHGVRQLLVVVVLIMWSGTVLPAPITSDDVRVIDGDTIRLHQQKPDVRLVGFNAPETRRAVCDAERALGDKATARLRDPVRSSKLDFEFVACACSGHGGNVLLQLREALRHAQGQWQRRGGHPDQRESGRVIPLRTDTVPAHAEAVVQMT
jgi:endonuclease YncB( thermonuclease family)